MAHNLNNVSRVYKHVIDEVIKNVRESFLNDGVDEQVLQELKQIWENKVTQSRAVEVPSNDPKLRTSSYQQHPPTTLHPQTVPTTVALQSSVTQASAAQQQYITSRQFLPAQYTTQILMPGNTVQAVHHAVNADNSSKGNPPPLRPAYHGMQVPTIQPTRTQQQMHTLVHPHATTTTTQPQSGGRPSVIIQLDGPNDSDSEEDDDDDEEDDFNTFCQEDNDGDDKAEEDFEPLNSDDDESDGDNSDHFDTDNVVVCQYDRITRSKNKWKFHLKDGIMNLNGKDYVFTKANGDAEW